MAAEVRSIALSGYYGFGNSGDEAVLLSILTALERAGQEEGLRIQPIVLSGDPVTTSRLYGVQAAHRMKPGELLGAIRECDGLISGGGSLLQDATSWKTIPYYLAVLKLAQWFRKPTFIYAQGVGPVGRQAFYPYIRRVFNKSAYLSVRDAESADLLARMGVSRERIDVVPDPVMGLELPEGRGPMRENGPHAEGDGKGFDTAGRPIVGVSLRFWKEDRSDMRAIADLLMQAARQRPVHLRLLPFHGEADTEASQYVMDLLREEVRAWNGDEGSAQGDQTAGNGSVMSLCPAQEHPQAMLYEVSRCRALIGMRLHSLIYAASQDVPMVGISYDPKIDQFLHRLGMKAAGSTDSLDSAAAAGELVKLLDGADSWRETHRNAIAALKREAMTPAQNIVRRLLEKK
ncbi:polysaccharide pyruvyl transferase CsaB [Paenibacillus melissococcoides]|uniref:Polysaccharide pyruvyl transferase CsaB n=1 Tax=Paenibacillus melissococcoides TaxID=2912268 RepID=A0ABM9G9W2_9BACL|nr:MULTISPECIES: polysaccharide pyruvyl transferase CsaB [Paenibacillus]MEB9897201.1 polysaccharide pyruvyl transferase CsaB [Bacillus cereus]CAH8248742.1 polysaccharide pyruvyl transferase CsaB [Paenibacillus melissococcoides]CAH8713866.1 polysaccharide pyruvyl transferase CsaB [Paenibacillus melissococcoides]CAH8720366.1 polysaccharide pyruvyl transferase CsaB [Paenibacillus melissococcoides]GIO78422.1 polysaccharide pyruvyl transferase CsaB [Paenibacillus dendritiformis]